MSGISIRTAFNALSSQRHEAMVMARRDIDTSFGEHSETHSGIGAWKDGARRHHDLDRPWCDLEQDPGDRRDEGLHRRTEDL
jgi:hypothetical protein